MVLKIGVCFFKKKKTKHAAHSFLASWAQPFFHERAVLCVPAGQYWDAFMVSQECLSGSEEKPHLFLCAARVFGLSACHCEFVPKTQASTLILCQMKGYSNNVPCLTLLCQEINELLPSPRGVHVFSSSCEEVEGSENDSSQLKGSDFRSIQPFRLMGEAKHTYVVHYTVCTAISEHYKS